jgi:rare lipoprotein A
MRTMSCRGFNSALLLAALALAGCATRAPAPVSAPPAAPPIESAEARPPDSMQVPDALPALEPIRAGGPNKPYAVLGETYTPLPPDAALSERGLASWYGRKFHGRRTASGELYDMYAMTAAHRTLPLPSFARVSNPANGRSVIVRINDRGPFVKGRIVDLSYTAAQKLGVQGLATVQLVRITPEEIRSGAWKASSAAAQPLIDGDEPPLAGRR